MWHFEPEILICEVESFYTADRIVGWIEIIKFFIKKRVFLIQFLKHCKIVKKNRSGSNLKG